MSEFITHSDLAYASDNSGLKKEVSELRSKLNNHLDWGKFKNKASIKRKLLAASK